MITANCVTRESVTCSLAFDAHMRSVSCGEGECEARCGLNEVNRCMEGQLLPSRPLRMPRPSPHYGIYSYVSWWGVVHSQLA